MNKILIKHIRIPINTTLKLGDSIETLTGLGVNKIELTINNKNFTVDTTPELLGVLLNYLNIKHEITEEL